MLERPFWVKRRTKDSTDAINISLAFIILFKNSSNAVYCQFKLLYDDDDARTFGQLSRSIGVREVMQGAVLHLLILTLSRCYYSFSHYVSLSSPLLQIKGNGEYKMKLLVLGQSWGGTFCSSLGGSALPYLFLRCFDKETHEFACLLVEIVGLFLIRVFHISLICSLVCLSLLGCH